MAFKSKAVGEVDTDCMSDQLLAVATISLDLVDIFLPAGMELIEVFLNSI